MTSGDTPTVRVPYTWDADGSLHAVVLIDGLDGFQIDTVVRLHEGVAELVELHVVPLTMNWANDSDYVENAMPLGGLTTRALRKIPVDAIKRELRAIMERRLPFDERLVDDSVFERGRQMLAEGQLPTDDLLATEPISKRWVDGFRRRPGRGGRPDIEYAQLARRYVSLLGQPAASQRLARQMHYDETNVRNLLTEARKRGLLTPAPRGRQGGELTEKARRLLEGDLDGEH